MATYGYISIRGPGSPDTQSPDSWKARTARRRRSANRLMITIVFTGLDRRDSGASLGEEGVDACGPVVGVLDKEAVRGIGVEMKERVRDGRGDPSRVRRSRHHVIGAVT